MSVTIPKLADDDIEQRPNAPGWFQPVRRTGIDAYGRVKPVIRCNCGMFCGIGLHHVHPDGRVTASFYHKKGPAGSPDYSSPDGCEWHVFLTLADYHGGEFPPDHLSGK
jgi:hypothetical protein